MNKTILIDKVEVTVSAPYAAGHVVTEAEAKALNQTRAENIGNSFRTKIKAAKESGEEAKLAEVLAEVAAYDATYVFAVRTAAARSTMSPIEKEALRLARMWLLDKLRASNMTFKDYKAAKGEDYVDAKLEEIAAQEAIQAQARKNVAAAAKTAEAVGVEV